MRQISASQVFDFQPFCGRTCR